MERVQGEKAGEYFPDLAAPPEEYRRAIGMQLATALANLHAVPLGTLATRASTCTRQVSESSLSAAVNGMAARIGDLTGPPIAAVPLARQWLLDHIDDVVPSGPLCLLQGDFGLHNTLVEGDRVDRIGGLGGRHHRSPGPRVGRCLACGHRAHGLAGLHRRVPRCWRIARGDRRVAVRFYRVFFGLGACMSSRTAAICSAPAPSATC